MPRRPRVGTDFLLKWEIKGQQLRAIKGSAPFSTQPFDSGEPNRSKRELIWRIRPADAS